MERGCTAFQIFCGNPRAWHFPPREPEEAAEFRERRCEADLRPLFVHSCYLINPCSLDEKVSERSVDRLARELDLSSELGADYYVLHPGSHKGKPRAWGVRRASETIAEALGRAADPPPILLENTASRHGPGGDMGALGDLVGNLAASSTNGVGIALDSCHAFGAGYDLRREAGVKELVWDIADCVGLERVCLLHVNDSRDPPGGRRDRHEHIGRGTIGEEGLGRLLNHPAVSGLPLILETPWESVEADRRNLQRALSLLEGDGSSTTGAR